MQLDHDSRAAVGEAVDLVNTDDLGHRTDSLTTAAELAAFLDTHSISGARAGTEAELRAVRQLRQQVRRIFDAAAAGEHDHVVDEINQLIIDAGATPQLVEHDGNPLHLHFSPADAPLHQRLGADMGVGLAIAVRDGGLERLRVCESSDCGSVLVDLSRNHSRRYCGPLCANRHHVAAYRSRQAVLGRENRA